MSKTQVCLSVKPNDPQQQIICLEADRKYSIPAFQREVRWDDNNLKMLLYDLSRSSKFLGNIILTIKSDHTCEIIQYFLDVNLKGIRLDTEDIFKG